MERQIEKIRGFSRIIHFVLLIAFCVLVTVSLVIALAYILKLANPNSSSSFLGMNIMLPKDFAGNSQLALPEFCISVYDLQLEVRIRNIFSYAVMLIALLSAAHAFGMLYRNENPFCVDAAQSFRKLAVILLIYGAIIGIIGFVGSAIAALLYFFIDYCIEFHNKYGEQLRLDNTESKIPAD